MQPRGQAKWPAKRWAYSNYGNLWGIAWTMAAAKREIEASTGEPWEKNRHTFEIWKCEVRPVK